MGKKIDSNLELSIQPMGFPGDSVVKNPFAKAGDLGSIPGSGRSLEEEMATHPRIPGWEIPLTEKGGRLQSIVFAKSQTTLRCKESDS